MFCGIVDGSVPSTIVAENPKAVAFMDISPVTHGHVLVVPRTHSVDLFDVNAEDLAACAQLAQQVAVMAKDRLAADGVNLLNCSGAEAWQSVFHFHLHVVPRFRDQPGRDAIGLPWNSVPGDLDEIKRIGARLAHGSD